MEIYFKFPTWSKKCISRAGSRRTRDRASQCPVERARRVPVRESVCVRVCVWVRVRGARRDLTQLFKPAVAMVSTSLYGQRSQSAARAALLGTHRKRMWCFAPERSVTSGVLQRTAKNACMTPNPCKKKAL